MFVTLKQKNVGAEEPRKVWTEEEFLSLPDDEYHYELVDGEVVMNSAGMRHGEIAVLVGAALITFVRSERLGSVCDSSTGFRMKSGNYRSPDVSFISKEQLQGMRRAPLKMFQGAPNLAVEILSPTDTIEGIHNKIVELFDNGTKLVWVVNPLQETVLVHHSPQPDKLLFPGDTLDGEEILPGFSLVVAELFAEWEF